MAEFQTPTTYDFSKVIMIVDGVVVTGWADDTAISIEKTNDDVELIEGADGNATFVISNSRAYTITMQLKQTSPMLAKIQQLVNEKKVFNVSIIDNNTFASQFATSYAMMTKSPTGDYAKSLSNREVSIVAANVLPKVG